MRRRRTTARPDRDDGSVLILALLVVVVLSLMVTPLLTYGWTLSRQRQVVSDKSARIEAVKGGVRLAMASPTALYQMCADVSPSTPRTVPIPALRMPVSTTCSQAGTRLANLALRYDAVAVAKDGAVPSVAQKKYPGSGSSAITDWLAQSTTTEADDKIWLPNLPVQELTTRSPTGWAMPAVYGGCRVYFPGTYDAAVTIAPGATAYFASGIYYFTKAVTIGAGATVVVGSGAKGGCASDQEAWLDAVAAPPTHGISGGGGLFVFGDQGRLVVNATSGNTSVVFNQRYAQPATPGQQGTTGVSIASVNGEWVSGTFVDTQRTGLLKVPKSMVAGTTPKPANDQGYNPSVLIPAVEGLSTTTPVVDLNLSAGGATLAFEVAGYVAVPQGRVDLESATGAGTGSKVVFGGGLLAATMTVSGPAPGQFVVALLNPVVQRTFRITATTVSGLPKVTSDALVFVNENGNAAVKVWTVS